MTNSGFVTRGYCSDCSIYHDLDSQNVQSTCLWLMEQLDKNKCIDFFLPEKKRTATLTTDYLFGDARGKMFGVLVAKDRKGIEKKFFAFSGQYNGLWSVPGWVNPLFDPEEFDVLIFEREKKIKEISWTLKHQELSQDIFFSLKKERKSISRGLMKDIHQLYKCLNFNNEVRSLTDIYQKENAPPSGTGDCCAPKLLNHAAKMGLQPTAMAEFYWGRENHSLTRFHGRFYPPCESKCEPILGYLLCGIGDK